MAFIETAWRRYTKHSRNKAQEIQGAILPLAATHRNSSPFIGAILAGVFTEGALTQLRSLGFAVLYFPYETVVAAFGRVGIDARYDEGTPDSEFEEKVSTWDALLEEQRNLIADELLEMNSDEVQRFIQRLHLVITRQVELCIVLPLHGAAFESDSVDNAIAFIEGYAEDGIPRPLAKYEIQVRYKNGDRIEGTFGDKVSAIKFLQTYQSSAL